MLYFTRVKKNILLKSNYFFTLILKFYLIIITFLNLRYKYILHICILDTKNQSVKSLKRFYFLKSLF
nr:MAG TPA: hypothetical protein [Caudoviricetes sp.]